MAIKKLKPNKAPGADNITVEMIQAAAGQTSIDCVMKYKMKITDQKIRANFTYTQEMR